MLAALACAGAMAQPSRDERDAGGSGAMTPAELRAQPISFELDIPYAATGNPRHRLDLYLPRSRKLDTLPVIVFFHGGGWLQGDKADGAARLLPFVRSGEYAGVAAGYRLSGEATWPAQLHDAKAAVRWVRANAARLGLDPARIGAWGRGAGGHLALTLGTTGDLPHVLQLEGSLEPHAGVSSRVAAVASYFAATDLPALIGQDSDIDRMRPDAPEARLIGGALPDNPRRARSASPIAYVSTGDPPVLIVHGSADRVVPYNQALRLIAALREAGVRSYLVTVRGAGHGDFPRGTDRRTAAFFGRYLQEEGR